MELTVTKLMILPESKQKDDHKSRIMAPKIRVKFKTKLYKAFDLYKLKRSFFWGEKWS